MLKELEVFQEAEWIEPKNRFVFWSGGRDSTVALHLALRAWKETPPRVVFVDTGIILPETLEYVHSLAEQWNLNLTVLKPETDFWKRVKEKGFPIIKALWCRRLLKITPIRAFLEKEKGWKVQVLGIRRSESPVRRTAWYYEKPFMQHRKMPSTYNLLPILNWSKWRVEDYIRKHRIPLNPSYKIYGTSGCYFCPFVENERHYLALKRLHPELFQKIVEAERSKEGRTALVRKKLSPLLKQHLLEDWL
ncbi:MAG: hypothetical protein DRI61_03315 [Chloroflexi bacterium]|nr:MAG: hypothetical protein DRI61_03315 [Chloroflexota bacterium]